MPIVSCSLEGKPGYKWGESGKCYTYDEGDVQGMRVARSRAAAQASAAYSSGFEESVKLPSYVVSALKKGLELHKDGKSGEGLRPATVRAATDAINSGTWSEDKIIRASAWLARHASDKDLKGGRDWSDPPTPGYVAWLLWGDPGDGRGKKWLDKKADELRSKNEDAKLSKDDRNQRTPAPPSDRIKGGKNTGKAAGSSRASINLNDRIVQALKKYVKDHNDAVGDDDRKRASLPMLKKVWLRGAGAYSSSHRPGVSRSAWAYGRVRAFLKMLKNLKPDDPKYNGPDNDLLPAAHPLSSKKEESQMYKYEGHKYEGYGRLYEGDFGKKFVDLKYELGKMLYYFGKKDLSGDQMAESFAKDLVEFVSAVKEKPEHGLMARSSYYHTLGELCDFIVKMVEAVDGREITPAVSEMIQFAMLILSKCEEGGYKDNPPVQTHADYDDDEEDRDEGMYKMKDHDAKCASCAEEVSCALDLEPSRRAALERRADSLVLIAERMGMGHEFSGLKMLIDALDSLRG
jgi:hypothetical protein